MASFSKSIKQAADDAERLGAALRSLPERNSAATTPSGGGSAPTITFNTTVVTDPVRGRTIRTGDGSGTGGKDIQSRAFAYFGLSSANASAAFIAQIVKEFERMMNKSALSMRTMGGG